MALPIHLAIFPTDTLAMDADKRRFQGSSNGESECPVNCTTASSAPEPLALPH